MKNKQSLNCFEVLQNCSWLVLGDVKLQRDKLQSGRKQLSDLHLLCLTTPHHTFQPTPEIIYLNFLTCLVNSSRTFKKQKFHPVELKLVDFDLDVQSIHAWQLEQVSTSFYRSAQL